MNAVNIAEITRTADANRVIQELNDVLQPMLEQMATIPSVLGGLSELPEEVVRGHLTFRGDKTRGLLLSTVQLVAALELGCDGAETFALSENNKNTVLKAVIPQILENCRRHCNDAVRALVSACNILTAKGLTGEHRQELRLWLSHSLSDDELQFFCRVLDRVEVKN